MHEEGLEFVDRLPLGIEFARRGLAVPMLKKCLVYYCPMKSLRGTLSCKPRKIPKSFALVRQAGPIRK